MAHVTLNNGYGSFIGGSGVVSPVVTTPAPRVSGQDALRHVLDKVLCLSKDSSIRHSLKVGGYVKISQVIGMQEASMTVLFHVAREKETIQALQGFADAQTTPLGPIFTPGGWLAVTADMFCEYQRTFQWNFGSPPSLCRVVILETLYHQLGTTVTNHGSQHPRNKGRIGEVGSSVHILVLDAPPMFPPVMVVGLLHLSILFLPY